MKLGERLFAVGLLATSLGVACTGGVAPVLVGGPGPTDGEKKEGLPPGGGAQGQPQTSAQGSGSGSSGNGATASGNGATSGQGTTTSTSSGPPVTSSSSSGGGCTAGTQHCNHCVTAFDCGLPQQNTTLTCTSLELYTSLFACMCGSDGKGGKCGGACSKTCTQTGTDSSGCQGCLGGALTGTCSSEYKTCSADT